MLLIIEAFIVHSTHHQQVFSTESAGFASAYTYNAYGGRETMVEAKVGMDGTDFCVWLKVTFLEDVDDIAQHTNTFNIEASERYATNAIDIVTTLLVT